MSNYTFTTGIPNGALTPSQNRPTMTVNNDSINSIWGSEDHNGFNQNFSGTHKNMRLPAFTAPAVISSTGTQGSAIYTAAGTAAPTLPQVFFQDTNVTFHLSPIRAWATFDGTGATGPIGGAQRVNISLINHDSAGNYTVTVASGAVSGTLYGVLVTCGQSDGTPVQLVANYTPTSTPLVFNIRTFTVGSSFATRNSSNITFIVLQL